MAMRIYFLDGDDRIASGDWVDCVDEHAARDLAAERLQGHFGVEIWEGPRCVVRLLNHTQRHSLAG